MTKRKKYILYSWLPFILFLIGLTLYTFAVAIDTGTSIDGIGSMLLILSFMFAFNAPDLLAAISLMAISSLIVGIVGTIISILKTGNN